MRLGDARRALDLLAGRVRRAKGEVGRDGVGKKKTLLEHDADAAPQVLHAVVARVHAVDQQPPGVRVEKPRHQAHQRALARAGRAQDRHAAARGHVEVDVVQHRRLRPGVAEAHALETHRARQHLALGRAGLVRHRHRRVEDLEHPSRRHQRLLHAVHDRRHLVDLPGKLLEQAGEHHQARAEGKLPPDDQPPAKADQHEQIHPREQADAGREQADAPEHAALVLEHLVVARHEGRPVLGLAPEGLDHLRALERLREVLHHALHQRAVGGVARLYPFGEYDRRHRQDRRGRQAGQGQRRAQARHVGHIHRERDAHDDRGDEHLVEKHAHMLHVAGHTGDDRARAVRVVEPKIQPLQLRVNLAAQIDHEVLLHEDVHRHRVGVVEPGPQARAEQNAARDERQHPHRMPVGRRIGQQSHVRQRHHRDPVRPDPGRHVPHVVDAQSGRRQPRDAQPEQDKLQGQHLHRPAPITPRQPKQTPHKLPIGGTGGGNGRRREHRR